MIEKIGHYSLENHSTIYDEESLTALQLAGRTAAKVNEVIDQSNKLVEDTEERLGTFETDTIPNTVEAEVLEHIHDGDFDAQIDKYSGNLEARVDTLLSSVSAGSTSLDAEVIDIRTGYDRIPAENAGESVRNQFLAYGGLIGGNVDALVFDAFVEGEYYSTSNGGYGKGAEWKRSRHKIPCRGGLLFTMENDLSSLAGDALDYAILTCYDKDMTFLKAIFIGNAANMKYFPHVTPADCSFVGLTIAVNFTAEKIVLRAINSDGLKCIDYPWSDNEKKYMFVDGYWYTNAWSASTNAGCMIFPVTHDMKYIHTNMVYQHDAFFFDADMTRIAYASPIKSDAYGALYEVPENAALCVMNTLKSVTLNGDPNHLATYITISNEKKNGKLDGKKVLCIGDSLTWLDKQSGTNYPYEGYQADLRRRGAIVDSMGYSGYSYVTGGDIGSIYTEIVTGGADVSEYDCIVLFGGSNDVRIGATIGTLATSYNNPNSDPSTVMGAVSAIIKYIMQNNPTCEIYVCTQTATTATAHDFSKALKYRQALRDIACFWHVPCIDLFAMFGHGVGVNTDAVTYDGTHPNYFGMRRLGNIIAKYIENTTA